MKALVIIVVMISLPKNVKILVENPIPINYVKMIHVPDHKNQRVHVVDVTGIVLLSMSLHVRMYIMDIGYRMLTVKLQMCATMQNSVHWVPAAIVTELVLADYMNVSVTASDGQTILVILKDVIQNVSQK